LAGKTIAVKRTRKNENGQARGLSLADQIKSLGHRPSSEPFRRTTIARHPLGKGWLETLWARQAGGHCACFDVSDVSLPSLRWAINRAFQHYRLCDIALCRINARAWRLRRCILPTPQTII